ncbi:hypothetical protein SM19410_07110 [Xanthomonas hortorum pv. gardneri]|nr:hypothetical protein XGA_4069 [Xanthomonas hortorum ATCC 19865]KLA99150.1 hypothetical protein SM19410_07110 [Xanthomonas hortorum pv. gardneri]KLB01425.1 hypothetical protein SM17710_05110 [Xanthomonas hortorum pv. gardneri]KLB05298.1 hypothetical protein SM18210_04195 [Xanthomonas hortorum pv. gardneri]KLB11560.1 hypothetical protein SM22010_09275 [Xanthomonas hortorum pv. gardneri]
MLYTTFDVVCLLVTLDYLVGKHAIDPRLYIVDTLQCSVIDTLQYGRIAAAPSLIFKLHDHRCQFCLIIQT